MKIKLSVVTCKVLLGTSLALGIQGLYAADVQVDVNGSNNSIAQGKFSTPQSGTTRSGGNYVYDNKLSAGDTAEFQFNYTTYDRQGNTPNWYDPAAGYSLMFNRINERVTINVGEGNIKIMAGSYTKGGQAYAIEDLYNFNLTGTNIEVEDFWLNAYAGESTIKGDTTFSGGGMNIGIGGDDNGEVNKSTYQRNGTNVELYTFRNDYALSNQASISIDGNLDLTDNVSFTFNSGLLNQNQALLRVSKNVDLGGINYQNAGGGSLNTELGIGGVFSTIVSLDKAKLISANKIDFENSVTRTGILLDDDTGDVQRGKITINGVDYYNDEISPENVLKINSKTSGLLIDSRTYHSDLINKLNNIQNSSGYTGTKTSNGITGIATIGEFAGKEIKFEKNFLVIDPENDLEDMNYDFFSYYLTADESVKNGVRQGDAKNLYLTGGAAAGVLDNVTHGEVSYAVLVKTAESIIEWAEANGIDISNSFLVSGNAITAVAGSANDIRNNVERALDMITDEILKQTDFTNTNAATGEIKKGGFTFSASEHDVINHLGSGTNYLGGGNRKATFSDGTSIDNDGFDRAIGSGIFRLGNHIYVTEFKNGGVAVDSNGKYSAYQLVADRDAYDALTNSNAADKTALKYTRNDIFAQNSVAGSSVTGVTIQAKNQNIVARYLDNLESKLQGRTNSAGEAYDKKDLHTQDVGDFLTSADGGRTGLLTDEKGNILKDANGNTIAYNNGKILDELALLKFADGFADMHGAGVTETINSMANASSAMSAINSIINMATDTAVGSRVAMRSNPYATYAYKLSQLRFAAVASDVSLNYVDSYSSGIWATAFGGSNVIDGNSGSLYGVSIGFDKEVNDNVLLGAYFTYADATIKDNLLKQESNNFQVGLYSSIEIAPSWELNLKAFGQISPNDQDRRDSFGDLYTSDFTRKTLGLNANVGKAFKFQNNTFVVKPFVGANYYLTYTPSVNEKGGLNPWGVSSVTNNNVSLEAGTEFRKYTDELTYLFITPKIEQYVANSGLDMTATLAGMPLETANNADKLKTYVQAIIGGNFAIKENFSANAGLGFKQIIAGKVDGKNETFVAGQVGFKYKF